ncbi:hypothetical protein [Desulfoscipio gibsoniae]|uniref:Uncharacterized protein n=1 Tax=Desulfoscipio gibsoniae DSM 7213 TaxID=767817 RepID=R4KEY5_9FIRM|nr:hypothetical protein [Desulfoscipio gibsoniae]AGL00232.1 hypothetical protein Desgi_0677 [Desulfoscipio gibsoniae DSM 7213]
MKTKYYKTWGEYKAEHPEIDEKQEQAMAAKMQDYEENLFKFIMFLCV